MSENEKELIHKIHTHTSGEQGIFANAYIIETKNGLVAVDAILTVSESKSLKKLIDSINKPLLATPSKTVTLQLLMRVKSKRQRM